MKKPTTYDEYVDLVHQAVYEVDEMRAGIEYDPENMERWASLLDHLDGILRKLYDEMVADTYQFPTGHDLGYMHVLNRWGPEFPFKQLLLIINDTHKNGLDRGKILLLIAVTVLVVWLFRSMGRKPGNARPPAAKGPEDMVRCEVCGVNLPRSEALLSRGRIYCCDQHRLQDQSRR